MNLRTTLAVPALAGLLVAATCPSAGDDFRAVAQAARSEMKAKRIPGAAVAIVRGGGVVYAAGFGDADAEKNHPVTPTTYFRIGSTTKVFVATAALLLASEGRLDLDRPVSDHVPGLAPKVGRLTMRQLLSHTAGLFDDAPMNGPGDDGALGREVTSWTDEVVFLPPGRFFSYSNPGYWLAGHVIEKVAGEPFADAMKRLVFEPLGMRHSTFRPEAMARLPLAAPFDGRENELVPAPNHAGTWPSGSLYSNVRDLSQLAIALLSGGRVGGRQALPESVVAGLLTPRVDIPERPGRRYGYGLVFETSRGASLVFHTGGRAGYGSMIRLVPDEGLAVVALTNRTSAVPVKTVDAATALFAGQPPPEPESRAGSLRKGAAEYEGTFACPRGLSVELFTRSILYLKRGLARAPVRLLPDGRITNGMLTFAVTRRPDGRVEYLHGEMHTLARVESAR